MGREVYGAGEGYFAAAKGGTQVANNFCDRCAGVGRSHVGVGNHRELRALKAKEVVCVGAGFEGYRKPWQRSGDGTGNLLNVVKIKRVSASIGEGLGHNDKVSTAAGCRNSKVKEQRLPGARNRGYCVDFAGVGRLKLHLDHGTYGLGGVNIHR